MPDLELRVWGLRSLVRRLMLYKSFLPSGPQFPHSQNGECENGSKILPRNKGKLQKNRYKLVKMEMACMSLSVLFQKEALLKLRARCRSQTWMCVSLQGLGVEGQRQKALLIKGKWPQIPLLCLMYKSELRSLFLYSLTWSKPYDFLCSMGH